MSLHSPNPILLCFPFLFVFQPSDSSVPAGPSVSCRLRAAKTDLEMTPEESIFIDEYLSAFEEEFEIELFLTDLNKYYQAHRVQLVSVV